MSFVDRSEAGEKLADSLEEYRGVEDGVVISLPRGGVVLGRIVADRLGLPLDIVVPRKIGAPSNPEYAIGAITEMGDIVWNEAERSVHDPKSLEEIVEKEKVEANRRMNAYRKGLPERVMRDRIVIIVDDGIATGFTMMAAIKTVRAAGPKRIVVAVPVASSDSVKTIENLVDELIVLETPTMFWAVGAHYSDFGEVNDDEVVELLEREKGQKREKREK
ncbi:MAG: phosphoribosyltransferase family protein [Patescibacteria group bacterium]|nr:phosphoribosyltransferase family protein [Patescibacteria group bacterium]